MAAYSGGPGPKEDIVPGKRPARRADGRPGPPKGYPRDQESYADPENWKYPVHTPIHARRARQYFDRPRNRAKYTRAEQEFVDARINAALQRFGLAADFGMPEERLPALSPDRASGMSRDDLLAYAAGRSRLTRAKKETPAATFEEDGPERWCGTVGNYAFAVDASKRRIAHDCPDFRRQATRGALCKHVCRAFLDMPEARAADLLRQLLTEEWDLAAE